MKWNATQAVSAVFVLALTAALAGQAHAACSEGQRIDHEDVNCLEAGWTNHNFPIKGDAHARSQCSAYGRVVVKVDRISGSDWTWHLTSSSKREDSGGYKIREISCCSDLSDLCDTSEMDDDSCLDRFRASAAGETCEDVSASINGDQECTINAQCETYIRHSLASEPQRWMVSASTTVSWRDVKDLRNCKGELKVRRC